MYTYVYAVVYYTEEGGPVQIFDVTLVDIDSVTLQNAQIALMGSQTGDRLLLPSYPKLVAQPVNTDMTQYWINGTQATVMEFQQFIR